MLKEYQVVMDGKAVKDWTVWGDDEEDALEKVKRQQIRGTGTSRRTGVDVYLMTPSCDYCGFRHDPPPEHLDPESYCC